MAGVSTSQPKIEDIHIDIESLITEIKNRPALWDQNLTDYSKLDIKRKLWNELVDIFSGPDTEGFSKNEMFIFIQKKWKNLRGCFTRELQRQRKKSGDASKRKSTYIYYKNLLFLKNVVECKVSDNNLKIKNNDLDTEDYNNEKNCHRKETSRKRLIDFEDRKWQENKNLKRQREIEYNLEQDQERMFLLSLVKPLKMVPEEERFCVQAEIMNIIQRAIKRKNQRFERENSYPVIELYESETIEPDDELEAEFIADIT